jgi:hypothetical protein
MHIDYQRTWHNDTHKQDKKRMAEETNSTNGTAPQPAAAAVPPSTSAVGAVTDDNDEERVDFAQLHPSVLFYRGMWRLTQLLDESDDSASQDQAKPSGTPDVSTNSQMMMPSPPNNNTVAAGGLSVVALHQRLLPPAPVNGLGEVADESYALQLAASDGIDLLRLNWHLLSPLLFPSCRSGGGGGVWAKETANTNKRKDGEDGCGNSTHASTTGDVDKAAVDMDAAPESHWPPQELYNRLQRPLSAEDLKVIREPGHMDRIYYSYIVLLRFFGWRVHDEERGLLDRNRAWAERYALLALHRVRKEEHQVEQSDVPSSPSTMPLPPPPTYGVFDFYSDGLPRVLRGLLDVGFLRLGVRLVEFVMEEMKSDRLLFLLPLVEDTLLPLVVQHESVEASHKKRLQQQLYRLTHSDSD